MNIPLTHIRFLERARIQFGKKIGIIEGDSSWTYCEYAERCYKLANLLISWNLKPSSRVAFLSYNSHHLMEAYYGVAMAGGILLPLNIRLTANDFLFILNDCQAEYLFFHSDFTKDIESIRPKLKSLTKFIPLDSAEQNDWAESLAYDQLLESQAPCLDFQPLSINEDDTAELFYTSGTTNRPKGVMLTHRNLYLHALETIVAKNIKESDVLLHTIPLFHANGWGFPQSLTCIGGQHVLIKKFHPKKVLQQINRHKITTFALVPTMANSILNFPNVNTYNLSSVRQIILGGSAANPHLIQQLERTFDCHCLSSYGLTETSPVLTLASQKSFLSLSEKERYHLQSMSGFPIPGAEIKIMDPQDQELPWDGESVGELVVQGDTIMAGYWNRSKETNQVFRNKWFHTGDMATINPDGYIQIVDRKKDIIISGGENISSLEIENVLTSHPAILECAVIPVPNPLWGENPTALVVLKDNCQASKKELLDHCRTQLANFKIPTNIKFLDCLPKGGTGKILKRELKKRYGASPEKITH